MQIKMNGENLQEKQQQDKNVTKKDYGIELYMPLYSTKTMMSYYKKEVKIKNYGQTYGILQQEDMS